MRKLEQYLENKANDVIYADTTYSKYFTLGDLKVRLSDHYSYDNTADIQIIIPINNGYLYTVFIKDSTKILQYNTKELIGFLDVYSVIKQMQTVDLKKTSEINKAIPIYRAKGDYTKQKYCALLSKTSGYNPEQVKTLAGMLHVEFGVSKGFNGAFQTWVCSNIVNFDQVCTLYKYLCVDNDFTPTKSLLDTAYKSICYT